jgi:hypothetical protein
LAAGGAQVRTVLVTHTMHREEEALVDRRADEVPPAGSER